MAKKRMFSKDIVQSDVFLSMPTSSQLLYFQLGMNADDDGFVNSPKKIIRMTGASDDDLSVLILKKFIISKKVLFFKNYFCLFLLGFLLTFFLFYIINYCNCCNS